MTRLSLAQQIAQFETPNPTDVDPEDVHLRLEDGGSLDNDDAGDNVETSDGREHYVDVGRSAIRTLNYNFADPKYSGVQTMRKQLLENESSEDINANDESEGEENSDLVEGGEELSDQMEGDEELSDQMGEDEELSEEDDRSNSLESTEDPNLDGEEQSSEFHSLRSELQGQDQQLPIALQKSREEDRRKGQAVSRQLALFDALLDARIRLQKSITLANELPNPTEVQEIAKFSPRAGESVVKLLKEASSLSEEMFNLQETFLRSNESIKLPPRKRTADSAIEDSFEEYQEELNRATAAFSALEHAMHPDTVQTLHKWSSKTLAISPTSLLTAHRPTFSKSARHGQKTKSVLQMVDEVLADLEKLRARTRVLRSSTGALKGGTEETPEREIFDDTDFYQGLLRELINSRTGSGAGEEDWVVERKQKKKKEVDTKASKGRKLRYETHEKLQNFMVPIHVEHGGWHEEQVDELFASLFGKGFEGEGSGEGSGGILGNGVQFDTDFRVFG